MRVNISKDIEQDGLISHIILNCMTVAAIEQLDREPSGYTANIKMTVNGKLIELEKFINEWQSQVDRIIEDRAKKLIQEKYSDVFNELSELGERVNKTLGIEED